MYALRALARDLKCSPAYVSQVFSTLKNPSKRFIDLFCAQLKLTTLEKNEILCSSLYHSLVSEELREIFSTIMIDVNIDAAIDFKPVSADANTHTGWIPVAIVETLKLNRGSFNLAELAKTMKVSEQILGPIIDSMEKAGQLSRSTDGDLQVEKSHLHFAAAPQSAQQIREFHIACANHGIRHLQEQTDEEAQEKRLYFNLTAATNATRVKLTKDFLLKMAKRVNATLDVGSKEEIYHLNVQFYPAFRKDFR